MTLRKIGLGLALVLATACVAPAAPLDLTVDYPLVNSPFLSTAYDAEWGVGVGRLVITAYPSDYNPDGSSMAFIYGDSQYVLTIGVVPATGEALWGSLVVTGDLDDGAGLKTLFSSDQLVAFGFGVQDKFEAKFIQESGAFAPIGAEIGTIADARYLFPLGVEPSFTADFGGSGSKSDTFVVPEPVSMLLTLPCLVLAAVRRRRR